MTSSTDTSPTEPPSGTEPDERGSPLARLQTAQPPMRYPNSYVWLVFVSAMDIMLTWAIIERDGTELNPIAAYMIPVEGQAENRHGVWAARRTSAGEWEQVRLNSGAINEEIEVLFEILPVGASIVVKE